MTDPDFIIVGAGITGLTAAITLKRAGKNVLVLETAPTAGGKIGTERVDGYLLESGPNSIRVENQETLDLIESVELRDRMIDASTASKKRFILKNGKWVKVPGSPIEAIMTPLFSIKGKLRILAEPFIAKTNVSDESATSFVTRRLGSEVFNYAADPFITGIYAGDPAKLSMRHSFSSMWDAEQQHGSLIKGMLKKKKSSAPKMKARIISFPNGLSELIDALRNELGDAIRLHDGAIHIEKINDHYGVSSSAGYFRSPQLILALPSYNVSKMIASIAPAMSTTLEAIDYPPVAVVYLGYRIDQFVTPPEGFGGLIPSSEKRKILGVIFSSSNFACRAPEDHLLLTVLMGGARNREVSEWSEEKILATGIAEAHSLFRPNGAPVFQHTKVWKHAIPQYNVGYSSVLDEIAKTEVANPGLHFLGNYRGGVSMGSCIRNATELAKRLV